MKTAQHRDEQEKDTLVFTHVEQRQELQRRVKRLKSYEQKSGKRIENDLGQYREISQGKRDVFERIQNKNNSRGRGPSR